MVTSKSNFPRGFAYAQHSFCPPLGFVKAPVIENLWVDPWLKIDSATYRGTFVVVLGEAVFQNDVQGVPSSELLSALSLGQEEFFDQLKWLAGRYAVFYGNSVSLSVVADATATRSVFYAENGGVVASHAALVEYILGGNADRSDFPARLGFPGNRTPYSRTKILTANLGYKVKENQLFRYWPTKKMVEVSPLRAAEITVSSGANALTRLAKERPIAIAMTAGFDSRLILATAVKAGIDFETFTYGEKSSDTKVDRLVAKELAELVGVEHSVPPVKKASPVLSQRLEVVNYGSHHKKWVAGMTEHFKDPETAIVSGNLMELGRGHYTDIEAQGLTDGNDPSTLAKMYVKRFPRRTKREIEATIGMNRYLSTVEKIFAQWLDDIGGFTPDLLPGVTQFYWEHRMAAWYGPSMLERDFYGESFIPFNSHGVFEVLLGVDKALRESNQTFIDAIDLVDGRLLEIHVNPAAWPTKEPINLHNH